MQSTVRRAARLIVADSAGRLLLFAHQRPNGERFWATPGGGLEPGETLEQAAAREAWEELGVLNPTLRHLWQGSTDFEWDGRAIHQEEHFFLLRGVLDLTSAEVRRTQLREGIRECRWWTLVEIRSSAEAIFPSDLSRGFKFATSLPPDK